MESDRCQVNSLLFKAELTPKSKQGSFSPLVTNVNLLEYHYQNFSPLLGEMQFDVNDLNLLS